MSFDFHALIAHPLRDPDRLLPRDPTEPVAAAVALFAAALRGVPSAERASAALGGLSALTDTVLRAAPAEQRHELWQAMLSNLLASRARCGLIHPMPGDAGHA